MLAASPVFPMRHDCGFTSSFVASEPERPFSPTTSIGSRSPHVDRVGFPSAPRAT